MIASSDVMKDCGSSVDFFFNDTATTEIYTLSLHDALPIFRDPGGGVGADRPDDGRDRDGRHGRRGRASGGGDRKSTRLNSSHANISYAVFCLKKKNNRFHLPPILSTNHMMPSEPDAARIIE